MTEIRVTNPKIVQFYDTNKNFDFENVNLLVIDFLDSIINAESGKNINSMQSQLLGDMAIIKQNFSNLTDYVHKMNDDIANTFQLKFLDAKKDYLEEYKNILLNTSSNNNEKIFALMQQNTLQLIDKTNLLLNDIIPKGNDTQIAFIRESFVNFQKTLTDETAKYFNSSNKEENLQNFLNNFENKYNALTQPLYNIINSSEERIHKEIGSVKNGQIPENLVQELSDFFNKYKNSSYKVQIGEQQLETTLNKIFPSDEVLNTSALKASCDFRINRQNKETILVETKEYDRNVSLDEVKKFIRDIESQKCHGIFLSQHSGITSKQNFQMDMIGKQIVIYIHNVKYDPTIIKMAIDIIDNLSEKMELFEHDDSNDFTLSEENLNEIYQEYSLFVTKKLNFIEILKDTNKRLLQQIEDIKFPCLSKIVTQNCGNVLNNENVEIICNICNRFSATNNKSLAAHQRGCKKRHPSKSDTIKVDV